MTTEVLKTPSSWRSRAPPLHPLLEFWSYFKANFGAVAGLVVIVVLVCSRSLPMWLRHIPRSSPTIRPFSNLPSGSRVDRSPICSVPDAIGRDILSRLIHGARLSLLIGIAVVTLSVISGTILGLVAGFFPRRDRDRDMRLMDITLGRCRAFARDRDRCDSRAGLMNAMLAVAIVRLPHYVEDRARGRDQRSFEGLRHRGQSRRRRPASVDVQEVLPNCAAPLIVQATLGISTAILDAASARLSRSRCATAPAGMGNMLADAREFVLRAWWVVTLPGLAILVTVLAFNLLGDGLRDALDPKLKR